MVENELSKIKIPRAIAMLLHLKRAAIEDKDNRFWVESCGVAPFAMAKLIDCLIDEYNRTVTKLANAENEAGIWKRECDEWESMGFEYSPLEYSEVRQAELKALAEKWAKEDADDA